MPFVMYKANGSHNYGSRLVGEPYDKLNVSKWNTYFNPLADVHFNYRNNLYYCQELKIPQPIRNSF